MKKHNLYIWILLAGFAALLRIDVAKAQSPVPPTPLSPTIDFLTDAAETVEAYSAQALTVQDNLQKLQSETIGKLKSFADKVKLKLQETLFGKEEGKPNLASVRTIEKCKIADITNEESIVEAFHTLFLTYPADILEKYPENERAVKQAYRDKAVEFGNDAMIEAYITVRDLEEKMAALKAEYDELSTCYVKGESSNASSCAGASSSEEELGVWSNYYKLNVIYDSMLKITEELMALKAQYGVAQAVLAGIEPIEETEEETVDGEKVSSNDVLIYSQTRPMAFAQMFSAKTATTAATVMASPTAATAATAVASPTAATTAASTSAATAKASGESTSAKVETFGGMVLTGNNAAAEQPDPNLESVQPKSYNVKSPFAGTAEQFQSSMLANNAYQYLQKALKVHNLKQQLPEYRKIFIEYNKMKALHEKAVEQLLKSESCNVNYVGNYYTDPVEMWYGRGCKRNGRTISCDTDRQLTSETLKNLLPGDVLCADNKSKICSSYDVTDYSSREGFSGWLISAYKAAKAEKTLDLGMEDFAASMTDESVEADVSQLSSLSEQYGAEASSGTADSSLLRPSDEPKTEATIREQGLISWQIGAEAAKQLGKDMVAGTSEWGAVKAEYPMWDDVKLVYDQYLNEKYKNMEIYVKAMDLRPSVIKLAQKINDMIPSKGMINETLSFSDIKEYNSRVLEKLENALKENASISQAFANIEEVQDNVDKAIDGLRSSFNAKMASLNNQKTSIYENLDNENIALNDLKTTYNTAMEDKASAEGNIEGQKVVIEISQERKAKSPGSMSNFEATAESSMAESDTAIAEAEQTAESVLPGIETQRESIDELKIELADKEEEITRAKNDFAADASSLEAQSLATVKNALLALQNDVSSPTLGESDFLSGILRTTTGANSVTRSILSAMINVSDNAAERVRSQMLAEIRNAAEAIDNMENNRFESDYHNEIVAIHKRMLNNMQRPEIDISITGTLLSLLGSPSAINGIAEEIITQAAFAEICPGDACYKSDDEYFVGLPPKPRDFMAPEIIATTPTAPLREIIHFDTVDFADIIKSDTWMTTREDFLDMGQDLPGIWQRILGRKGFVERDVDIEKILSHNSAALDAIKPGYPCTTGKYDVTIRNGQYHVSGATGNINRVCPDINSISITRHVNELTGEVSYFVQVHLVDGSVSGTLNKVPEKELTSELATVLAYKDGLTFSYRVQKIMEFYENLETAGDVSEEDLALEDIYKKELLTRNQFGNFLDFIEQEMLYQDNLDQLDVKVENTRQKIKEQLEDVEYKPAEDFDLSDDDTYNEIMSALDSAKNDYVEESVNIIQSIQPLNDVLEEKLTKVDNIAGALQMDSDELVQLNDNMAGDSELAEKIKSKQADNAARDEYDKEAQDVFGDNLNNFEEPYCIVYE